MIVLVATAVRLYFDLVEVDTVQLGQHTRPATEKSGPLPDRCVRRALPLAWYAFISSLCGVDQVCSTCSVGVRRYRGRSHLCAALLAQPRIWPTFLLTQLALATMLFTRFWQRGAETVLEWLSTMRMSHWRAAWCLLKSQRSIKVMRKDLPGIHLPIDTFISYATPDFRHAMKVCARLEAKGLSVWIAPRNISPGANWSDSISKAIDQTEALVVIFSAASNHSRQVFREVDYADHRSVPLLFLRIEDLEPTGGLGFFAAGTQWISAFSLPLKVSVDELFLGVRKILDSNVEQGKSPADIQARPQISLSTIPPEQRTTEQRIYNLYAKGWPNKPRPVTVATHHYEEWLRNVTTVVDEDLDLKRARMVSASTFLRSTFYRWLELFPIGCPDLASSPVVTAAGDVTVANFNIWRDTEHRLNWGMRWLDEAAALPYTSDLVRLGTSACISFRENLLKSRLDDICEQILSGYQASLEIHGRAFILEKQTARLRDIVLSNLRSPKTFLGDLTRSPLMKTFPREVESAFSAMMPGIEFQTFRRVVGLGSLGKRRFVGVGNWKGSKIAWEAREISSPAIAWLTGRKIPPGLGRSFIEANSVRSRDPLARMWGKWLVSILSPEVVQMDLSAMGKRDQQEWLYSMGWETANIHLGTAKAIIAVKADLLQRPRSWLKKAVRQMVKITEEDFLEWTRRSRN